MMSHGRKDTLGELAPFSAIVEEQLPRLTRHLREMLGDLFAGVNMAASNSSVACLPQATDGPRLCARHDTWWAACSPAAPPSWLIHWRLC